MTTRRHFLQATVWSLSLPAIAWGSGGNRPTTTAVFRPRQQCRDSETFWSHCHRPHGVIGTKSISYDIEQLLDVEVMLSSEPVELVMGLTGDSERFLVEQIALRAGYRSIYFATHKYQHDRLHHHLCGPRGVVEYLAGGLTADPVQWSRQLASVLPSCTHGERLSFERRLVADLSPPEDSPGYVTSWVFGKIAQTGGIG